MYKEKPPYPIIAYINNTVEILLNGQTFTEDIYGIRVSFKLTALHTVEALTFSSRLCQISDTNVEYLKHTISLSHFIDESQVQAFICQHSVDYSKFYYQVQGFLEFIRVIEMSYDYNFVRDSECLKI